jgi:hypothetical protein
MNKFKQTTQSPIGTSFHDTVINASVNDLTKVLGEPQYDANHGTDKINFEWMMELNDGSVFTVYDYKEYRVLDKREIIEWHVGGLNGLVTERAKGFIKEALSGVKDEWDKVIDLYKETHLDHYYHFEEWNQEHQPLLNFLKTYFEAPIRKPIEEKPTIESVSLYTTNIFNITYKGVDYVVRWNEDYDDVFVHEWDILDEDGTLPSKEIIDYLIDFCTPLVVTA